MKMIGHQAPSLDLPVRFAARLTLQFGTNNSIQTYHAAHFDRNDIASFEHDYYGITTR